MKRAAGLHFYGGDSDVCGEHASWIHSEWLSVF